ncbi:2-polyprenyl-3-methyl-5-hydroxy-6-metoxy-1,4-benzoquinol methylase [Microbacterium ginsengiterrae]|uniref:2-polyprenyl-3-methyl-5-hydroxy-6-metoxy-1, 4-benzoquinol methylase n=1 Tax=Microbacterium ginsengiterrae TaxID=546115 RepID=A0A7W9CA52_9MICO|nr:methyltransferase domain-containing protein [Microbacterium ginsengiterrae]MBB5741621.1 2-polyprenyl-3-methyl-5-hydroxy-6-metoxy-1,4-benzoquinol methylase [Microbacterium ginsengiterrae]
MSVDLTLRAVSARELMDDPGADITMLERTYDRFSLVNAVVSRWRSVYRREIRPRARRGPIHLLDVGAGGGDVSRAIAGWARRDGLPISVTALDADPRAIRWARERGGGVEYRCAHTSDLVADAERFDLVVSNHLIHHLSGDELTGVLDGSVALVREGGVVLHRDIARSRLAYWGFAMGTAPFAKNVLAGSFIREDGLISIRRSFTRAEAAEVVPRGWQVNEEFPARLELRWEAGDAGP